LGEDPHEWWYCGCHPLARWVAMVMDGARPCHREGESLGSLEMSLPAKPGSDVPSDIAPGCSRRTSASRCSPSAPWSGSRLALGLACEWTHT